jgi:outer membrane protein TolC
MKLMLLLLAAPAALAAADPAYIDLRTAMRLAGANNEEIEVARLRHAEAVVESKQAWQRFWPALTIGVAYRGHEGNLQDVVGDVIETRKQQYSLGPGISVDWSPGDIYYSALAAQQRAVAAEYLAEKARRDVVQEAVDRYYELLAAEANVAVVEDDLRLTQDYSRQIGGAVSAGTAIRADLLRVQTQVSRLKLNIRQSQETRDVAAAALASTLRLPAHTPLRPAKSDLVPVALISGKGVATLVSQAQRNREELLAQDAVIAAADLERKRAYVAPRIPSVKAGYNAGGLGGGRGGRWGPFDGYQDYYIGLGWTIGPGGLFDRERKNLANIRADVTRAQAEEIKAEIGREVVEAAVRAQSARDQIAINDEAVNAAEEMARLARERQASQIGVVLEYLLAREEVRRARQSRVKAVADYNKAQYQLMRAVGGAPGVK